MAEIFVFSVRKTEMKGEKMRKRRIIQAVTGLILSLTLIAGLGIGAFADEETGGAVDPERWMPLEEYEIIPGTAFEFVDSTSQEALMSEAQEYPAAFDLRELGYITPVRSQYPHGTCWGFAAMAAAESSLLSSGIAAEDGYDVNTLNLSEKYLVISAYTPFLKEGHPQNGEGFTLGNTPHFKLNRGGNATQASVGISTGFGIVHENSNPEYAYRGREGTREYAIIDGVMSPFGYSTMDDWEISQENRFCPDYVLQESYMLPTPVKLLNWEGGAGKWKYEYNEAGTNAIKKQLMAGRAVQIGYYAERSSPSQDESVETQFLSDNWAHYGTQMDFANHAVAIVGWDDNYPAENFLLTPQGNGAWLVKNSWGSGEQEFPDHANGSWGLLQGQDKGPDYEATSDIHTGYFWLSYYDHSLSGPEAVSFERANSNEIVDAHDYLTGFTINAREYKDEIRMANIFQASVSQKLTKISYYTTHPSTTAHWEIYLLPNGMNIPDMGLLVAEGTQTHEFGGFHKVELPEPVALYHGQRYVIVVTETLPDGRYTVNVSIGEKNEYKRIINEAESLCYKNEGWSDLASDPDLLAELATQTVGNQGTDPLQTPNVCDNFLIRGYSEPLEDDILFSTTEMKKLVFVSGRRSASVTIKPSSLSDLSAKNWSVEWKCLKRKNDTENLVTIEPYNQGFNAKISVRTENGQPVTGSGLVVAKITADGKDVGTVLFPADAYQVWIDSLDTMDMKYAYPYTGEEIKPEVIVFGASANPVPGIDCTITYTDNVKTGVAKITAKSMGDVIESSADLYFAITPVKAVLESVSAGEQKLTAIVQDQTDTGLTEYQFQYRPKGSEEWIRKNVKAEPGKTEYVLDGLKAGEQYEVQVCGLLTIPEKAEYQKLSREYLGEPSQMLTSDEILPQKIVPGWNQIDGKWFYYDTNGNMVKGWVKDNGKWYYLNKETGEMKTGWVQDGGSWYYLYGSGAMATGWVNVNDVWYYLSSSGAMLTGWQKDGSTWYFLKGSGAMAANEWCGGYWLSGSGAWVYQPRGSWKQNSTGWWFGDTSGWYAKNTTVKIDDVLYKFNEAGYWVK